MVCDSKFSFFSAVDDHKLPSPTSTTAIMDEQRRISSKQRACSAHTSCSSINHAMQAVSYPSKMHSSSTANSPLTDVALTSIPTSQHSSPHSRKRKFDELTILADEKNEQSIIVDAQSAEDDPLHAEADALWRKWPACPTCAYCASYRHQAQGCEHLIQRTSALGRYFQDLARSDPRRARGWFALYLRNCTDVTKLTCITEMLYRRACQQGVWRPILATKMSWPCTQEYALREFMIVCASFPTLWMTPAELLATKKALMHEAILLHSPSSSVSSSPRCSPIQSEESLQKEDCADCDDEDT